MQKLQMKKCFVQSGRYKINHEWKCQKKKKKKNTLKTIFMQLLRVLSSIATSLLHTGKT